MKQLTIGFIGNFVPAYSTENDRKWSLEKLGHKVVIFQENTTTAIQLMTEIHDLDLLIYSHTHDPSYIISDLIDVFKNYKQAGVPTVSVHLDRWVGLERARDIGKEATWKTEYQFMADFSPEAQKLYNALNLNVYYLKPAVVERDCYLATPDFNKFPHPIIFVGSKGYHPEYPFRPALVEFLHKTYGSDFGHYGNDGIKVVRGHDLNTLYASAVVAVGDSCFGGRPNYVSDRYYETRGRGGFLIHPNVDGVDNEGVWHYNANDLKDLKKTIDLALSEPEDREESRTRGFDWVRKNETYTQRMAEMLEVIFDDR